jgi:hypothetical protein
MGQDMNYDSENPADKDSEVGKILSKSIGQTTEVTVNETGKITKVKKPVIDDNEAAGMLGMLNGGDGNDGSDTGVKGIFANFNTSKVKAGDTWMDSTIAGGANKIVNTYLVKEIKGDEIAVNIVSTESKSFTKEQQGVEVLITMEIKSNGDWIYEKSTGMLKQSNVVAEATGNAEVTSAGMTIPMTNKTTTAITVKKM